GGGGRLGLGGRGKADSGHTCLGETAPPRQWIREHTPQDATVLAYFDAVLYMETGRRATRFSMGSQDPLRVQIDQASNPAPFMRSAGIRYLLVTPFDYHAEFPPDVAAAARDEIDRRVRASADFETLWSDGASAVLGLR